MLRRLVAGALAASVPVLLAAQIPSRNVNMVSGRTLPDGDPFLQRQNEGSIAASTRNPLHLLAGANDYRTIDLPGLGDSETADAWMGLFKSFDGGSTWKTTLLPGYPQDPNRSASPLGQYGAAADPVVRAGTNGLFYFSGIVFDRVVAGKNAMFVARLIDNNNKESGDPIVYLGASLVATNPGTEFIDKPWMAVDIPRTGAQTCSFTTTQPNPTRDNPNGTITVDQSFPGGPVYVAYSLIAGDGPNTRSQIYFSRSLDCGETWSTSQRISSLDDPVNQGATLAIDPRNGTIYIAWRRFSADGTDDTIMVTRSADHGMKWDPPGRARRFPRGRKVGLQPEMHGKKFRQPVELTDLTSLDQPTAEDRFRTNAYPTMTVDDQGRVYVAWSERGFAPWKPDPDDGDARILIASSTNAQTWTDPQAVDNGLVAGHQVMPSLAFAGGKLMLAYYDFREDVSQTFSKWIDETSAIFDIIGGIKYPRAGAKRHTVDVRAAMAASGATLAFAPSVRVSDYFWGARRSEPDLVQQLQFNPPNLPLFKLGTVPFFGDYIDLAPSPAFVPAADGWAYNTAPSSSPLFHAVWTDNRDVVAPPHGKTWADYTPVGAVEGATSVGDPTQTLPHSCTPGQEGMRNQNIYTARITGGLVAGSPGNTKPLSESLQRTFVVFVQNASYLVRTFRLTIENQPEGGRASFAQYPLPPYTPESPAPLTVLDVIVPPRSTIARTVYATSSVRTAQIRVGVQEVTEVNGAAVQDGLQSTILLNPDVRNPEISNPEISNPEISNPEISNAEVHNPEISNPEISNPEISNPDIANPDIANPEISNPEISNVQIANPEISNPEISNPEISNPEISNPEISNPEISNPEISNTSLTDTTWTITNNGNTTTAYTIKLVLSDPTTVIDPTKIVVQLILRRVYTTPVALNCMLALHAHNVLLANILNPQFTTLADIANPEISNPEISNATLFVGPGETAKLTIRTFDKNIHDDVTFNAAQAIVPYIVSQPINSDDVATPGALPPIDAPDNALLVRFVDLPTSGAAGQPYGPVRVLVTDAMGSPIPGAAVQLHVFRLPDTTAFILARTAVTGADGAAAFTIPSFIFGGTYRFRATVSSVGFPLTQVWSSDVVINPSPLDPEIPNPDISNPDISNPGFLTPGSVLYVANNGDAGAGSLREAIAAANADPASADVIAFNMPAGPRRITLASPLPPILGNVWIDATTQPGFAGTPVVTLDGIDVAAPVVGLSVQGPNVRIQGMAIVNFRGAGIQIGRTLSLGETNVAPNAIIQGNYIGVNAAGTAAAPNLTGILVPAGSQVSNLLIGGATPAQRNVISGNAGVGIDSRPGDYTVVSGNRIQGNYIGTNAAGTSPIPNGSGGIILQSPTSIGGTAPGQGNVISGNGGPGLRLVADDNLSTIQGNFIGTDASGMAAVPNNGPGISITDTENSTIGGVVAGARNVISGNIGNGIELLGDASATTIQGNYIGVNATGAAAIGNAGAGVAIDGTFSTQLGGADPAARNVISGNAGDGVHIDNQSDNNTVAGNYIGTDASGTVDLGNGSRGVIVMGDSHGNRIGAAGGGNLISGNDVAGVWIDAGCSANVVSANRIGTNAGVTLPLSNGTWSGVELLGTGVQVSGHQNEIGEVGPNPNIISGNGIGISVTGSAAWGNVLEGNQVGTGTHPDTPIGNYGTGIRIAAVQTTVSANHVAHNSGNGIEMTGTGNAILAPSIFSNALLGIDQLGPLGATPSPGVTPNDDPDVDGIQNFPVLTDAVSFGSTSSIAGWLKSTPGVLYNIRIFASPSCDSPGGHGEGRQNIATIDRAADGAGYVVFKIEAGVLVPGQVLTATARNITTGDTSEFSACRTITTTSPAPPPVPEAWLETAASSSLLFEPPPGVRDEPLLVPLRLE